MLRVANALVLGRHGVKVAVVPSSGFTPALLDELYELANTLSVELRPHFDLHAHSTDVVHVFRDVGRSESYLHPPLHDTAFTWSQRW